MSSSFTVGLQELRLKAAEFAQDRILRHDGLFRLALRGLREEQLLAEGRGRARLAAFRAWRFVPAYWRFLDKAGLASPDVPFERLPTMSRDSYVRAYPTEERCMGGSHLMPGVAIDESSGSTGQPFNWVQGSRSVAARASRWRACLGGRWASGRASASTHSA